MASFQDILQYPQYEQGGRFNLLALPQLLSAIFSKQGGQEATNQGNARRAAAGYGANAAQAKELGSQAFLHQAQSSPRSGAPELYQPGANLAGTEAGTEHVRSQTGASDLASQVNKWNFGQAQERAGRETAARMTLPSPVPGVPGELAPEWAALMGPVQGVQQGAQTFEQQHKTGAMTLDELQKLQAGGTPITGPGMAASAQAQGGKEHAATLASHDKQVDKSGLYAAISHYMNFPTQEGKAMLQSIAKASGSNLMDFQPAQGNPAQSVEAMRQAEKARPAAPGVASPTTSAQPPQGPQTQPNAQSGLGFLNPQRNIDPKAAVYEKLNQLLGSRPGLKPGGASALFSQNKGYDEKNTGITQQMMEQISGGKQYSGFAGDIPGPGMEMQSIQEILQMIEQLQRQPAGDRITELQGGSPQLQY